MYELNTKDEFISDMRLHILYCLLYGCSIIAALWQHGHAVFTCVVLILVFPMMILPFFKFFRNELTRSIMQISFPTVAGIWLVFRIINRVPSGQFLMESLTLAGLAFSFTLCKKDRAYFLLISSVLLMYGSVYPRAIFIHLIPLIMILVLLIFYLSRTNALCQSAKIPESKAVSKFSWLYLIPQTALMVLIAIFIYMLLPSEDSTSGGYLNSDFNNNTNYSPPEIRNWFKTKKIKTGKTGKMMVSGEDPSAISKKSDKLVSASGEEASFSPNGDGAGLPGDDLLFTVKSDVKLYWLVNLYDTYDGTKWKISKRMKKQRFKHNWDFSRCCIASFQTFEIKKWHTRSLPAAFLPSYFSFQNSKLAIDETFFGRKLSDGEHYPQLPFRYTASSLVPYAEADLKDPSILWWEKIPKKQYLKLPKNKISRRLNRKVREITENSLTDFSKAMALRDYLRNNFDYLQTAQAPPEGREPSDYFIFELKEGHCEYFASAMVVLARIAGLPARIATGFSPGNFNIMTKKFEVYEYHAHAWAQVFIEKKGWLTFDPTPPGEIISRTTPLGIGSLKDPFGDEWQVKPPELASMVQKKVSPFNTIKGTNRKEIIATFKTAKPSKLKQFILQIPADGQDLQDTFAQLKDKVADEGSFIHRILASFKSNFNAFINTIVATAKGIANFFYSINGIAALLLLIFVYPVYCLVYKIIKWIRMIIKRNQCEVMLNEAVKNLVIAPNQCIESCYFATRNLLEISGYENSEKMELFDYGTALQTVDLQLSKDVLAVFYFYTQMSYSMKKVKVADSEHTLERALNVRALLKTIK